MHEFYDQIHYHEEMKQYAFKQAASSVRFILAHEWS